METVMGDYFVVSLDKNIGKEIEMGHGFAHKEDAETYLKFLQNKEYNNIDYFIIEKEVEW
jgi:hypothetical protein